QQVKLRTFGSTIECLNSNQDIVLRGLRVLDKDVEVAILVEDAGVDEFKFQRAFSPLPVFFRQSGVGVGGLGIFVEIFHVGVSRRRVEIKVIFLDIFAVVALDRKSTRLNSSHVS